MKESELINSIITVPWVLYCTSLVLFRKVPCQSKLSQFNLQRGWEG